MKRRKRFFLKGIVNHVYQRAVDGFLLFYSVSDYLIYFTRMCVLAVKYRIRILAVSIMPDHVHLSLIAESMSDFSSFMRELTASFSTENNKVCHRSGQLFESPFGSAVKKGDKKARSNLLYVNNNGPERRLGKYAEQYRWNFLAYYDDSNPFSEPIVVRKASWPMKKAMREVLSMKNKEEALNYRQLQRLFKPLDRKEKEQLTDFIINTYNVLDYASAIRFFDTFEEMIIALHSDTGSENDINEVFVGRSDACFAKMISFCMDYLQLEDIHDVLALDIEKKFDLFRLLSAKTDALPEQVAAFLRIPVKKLIQ